MSLNQQGDIALHVNGELQAESWKIWTLAALTVKEWPAEKMPSAPPKRRVYGLVGLRHPLREAQVRFPLD